VQQTCGLMTAACASMKRGRPVLKAGLPEIQQEYPQEHGHIRHHPEVVQ
jgi:hypothetical protein